MFVPFQTCGSDVNKRNINFSSKQAVPYFRGYIYNTQTNKHRNKSQLTVVRLGCLVPLDMSSYVLYWEPSRLMREREWCKTQSPVSTITAFETVHVKQTQLSAFSHLEQLKPKHYIWSKLYRKKTCFSGSNKTTLFKMFD